MYSNLLRRRVLISANYGSRDGNKDRSNYNTDNSNNIFLTKNISIKSGGKPNKSKKKTTDKKVIGKLISELDIKELKNKIFSLLSRDVSMIILRRIYFSNDTSEELIEYYKSVEKTLSRKSDDTVKKLTEIISELSK